MDGIVKFFGYVFLALIALGLYSQWKEKGPLEDGAASTQEVVEEEGAGFVICNHSNEPNSVAFGQKEGEAWVTRGWYNLEQGACKALAKDIGGKTYYFYAEGTRGSVWAGKYNLCIQAREAFAITGYENCESRNYKTAGFNQVQVERGARSFTQNLTGGKLSKIDSLDVGDRVYVQGFVEDELATIVRIEKSNETVKVQRSGDGTTKWVKVSQIITREEAQMNDVGRAAVGATLIFCLFSPESCKQ